MIGFGLDTTLTKNTNQAAGGPPLPLAPFTLPWEPTLYYSAEFSTVAESGGKVVSATDLMGNQDAAQGGAGIGPRVLTDALGRKFWRFDGTNYLTIGAGITFANTRETTVFAVGRLFHSYETTGRIVSGGSVALGTTGNGASLLDARRASTGETAFIGNGRAGGTNKQYMVAGQQLQVMGNLRRTTANGGDVVYCNRKQCVVGVQGAGTTGVIGAEIGRYSHLAGSSGNWLKGDIYAVVIVDHAMTPAECLAMQTALADAYGIVEVTSQLILEGDSITNGSGINLEHNAGMVLGAPGAGRVPANYRVVNMGLSGNKVPDLVVRRDNANGWASQLLPDQNVVAFEIGRNDMGTETAASHYANVVAYINTPTTGLLQRGWTVRELANIATAGTWPPSGDFMSDFRNLIRDPQFLIDTLSGTGQAYEGEVSIVSTDLIEVAPDGTVFFDQNDATDTTYYQGDSTHPSIAGAFARATGGDTPQYGVAYGLV